MPKESVSDQEEVLVLSWKTAFVNDEVAFVFVCFIQVLCWVDFEDVIAHLEADWLDLGGDRIASFSDVAESLVAGAVKIWESSSPFLSNFLKNIWRNRKL